MADFCFNSHQHVQASFLLYLDVYISVLVISGKLIGCKLCSILQVIVLTALHTCAAVVSDTCHGNFCFDGTR
jgi:hypothetical protein